MIHVSVPKLVSPSESPWDILVQALSHTNTAACLCPYTQATATGCYCFLCLPKSTRYIQSNHALNFARKNHGLNNNRFFFFNHLEEISFSKNLGMICIALNDLCVRYCRVCICIYAETAGLHKEVCLYIVLRHPSEIQQSARFLVVRRDMLRMCKRVTQNCFTQGWFRAFCGAVTDF